MSFGVCLKKCTSSKFARLLYTTSKFALFSVSSLKDGTLILKKANVDER